MAPRPTGAADLPLAFSALTARKRKRGPCETRSSGGRRARLRPRPDARGRDLEGAVAAGGASVPPPGALPVTRGGFVLTRGVIARFADDGAFAWAQLLRRERLDVPAAETGEFVKRLAAAARRPHL